MSASLKIFGFLATFLTLYVVYGQEQAANELVSRTCLGCICEAASGCNTTISCSGEVCGPFRITWGYWADSGKPTIGNDQPTTEGAYPRCVNDPFCAGRAVQGYMAKYGKDCNGDGKIDCEDYLRIHRLGGWSCSGEIDPKYYNVFKTCLQTFG